MRRDVGRHAHGNPHRAVDQEVGKPGGEHRRLTQAVIEVGHEFDDLFFQIRHHLVGDFGKPRLGITVSGGGVAIHGAEVAVPLYQRVAERKILRHAHHRAVHGGVAVRVIAPQHVTDCGRRFAERLIGGEVILIHRVHNAALTGFHPVPHVRQGARHNHRHGVFDKRLFHAFFHVYVFYFLIRELDIAIVFDFMFHFFVLSVAAWQREFVVDKRNFYAEHIPERLPPGGSWRGSA